MKNVKRILLMLLALTLLFTLIACGDKGGDACKHEDDDEDGVCDLCDVCLEHLDDDEDGLCDNCDAELEDEGGEGEGIALIEDGEILFQVVLGSDTTSSVRMTIDSYADALEEIGATLSVVDEKGKEADLEVLIGTVKSRGKDYEYDKYSLGGKGYIISAVDETKIIINGGSESALVDAFTMFFEEMLGITDDVEELENFYFGEDHETLEIQDDYRIDSISVGDNDLKGYEIVRDRTDGVTDAFATKLQSFFYEKAGYFLEIVNPDDAGDKTITLRCVEKGKAGANGFRVVEDGDSLIIECAHKGKFEEAFNVYYSSFSMKQGDIVLGKFDGDKDYTSVYYKDFGAVGDGKTIDTDAIRAAHIEANKNNQTVYAEKGKTYRITKVTTPIVIKTDVDWRGCKFIFDATEFKPEDTGNVFLIDNDSSPINFYTKDDQTLKRLNADKDENGLVIRSINHGDKQTTKLDIGIREPFMLKVFNSEARAYIRWGYVDTKGGAQCEVVLVDKEGNIDPSTPFLIDYEKITQIVAYKIDVEPITIKNADIESRNSLHNLLGGYKSIAHSIQVSRPNVTLENLIHTVTQEIPETAPTRKNEATGLWEDVSGEGFTIEGGIVKLNGKQYKGDDVKPFTGFSYSGFVQISNTYNTLVKGCGFQARYHYEEGTYDISCGYATHIEFRNCTQNNFFEKDKDGNDTQVANLGTYWGVAGTNYCKNMYYVDSVLTRYDAHCGVFNGGVKGGKLAVLRLIGGGTFTIEGVDFHARSGSPVQLREDYGATFNGTVIIKDTYFNYVWAGTNYNLVLVDAPTAHIYNGYRTYFPNLIIDNIGVETTNDVITIVNVSNQTYSEKEHYPARCPIRDNVHDPDALFTYYFETANKDIVEQEPEKFYFLKGFKKVNKAVSKLAKGEYTVVDNGNGTYTVVAEGVKNLQPYVPPSFIEIRNMKDAKNLNGKKLRLQLYKSDFFKNTEIIDEDGVLVWVNPPKK